MQLITTYQMQPTKKRHSEQKLCKCKGKAEKLAIKNNLLYLYASRSPYLREQDASPKKDDLLCFLLGHPQQTHLL